MNKTTETQMLIYKHEELHPLATSSIAYKEIAKRAMQTEKELHEAKQTISEMKKGFIIKSINAATHEQPRILGFKSN